MKAELPNFVTKSFLEEILRKKYLNKQLIVEDFWAEWATKKGDNYASDMYRVHVTYKDGKAFETKPVLLKVNHE